MQLSGKSAWWCTYTFVSMYACDKNNLKKDLDILKIVHIFVIDIVLFLWERIANIINYLI
jgi:hypothetical protein